MAEDPIIRDLGPVSAYAYAVENGFFSGTEEEWITMLSNVANYAQRAADGASSAQQSATNAANSATSAAGSATNAADSATSAAESAQTATQKADATAADAANTAADRAAVTAAKEHIDEVAESIPVDYTTLSNAFYALGLSVDSEGYVVQTIKEG